MNECVELHPHFDLWMRGARMGTVVAKTGPLDKTILKGTWR